MWGLSILIEILSVIPTNSNSTTLQRISRELYHPSLRVQGHKEELPSPGTLHQVSFLNSASLLNIPSIERKR